VQACKRQWSAHHPITNALWLHYLADTLLGAKNHQLMAGPAELRALRGFRKRALMARAAADMVQDELFEGRASKAAEE
jgi:hypothetical protein